ncbi:hypothetical protein [Maridesulfovibrio hydrothermalis]|nr:hypothetical protein [Maridesulfovibrio hydrothermalis]
MKKNTLLLLLAMTPIVVIPEPAQASSTISVKALFPPITRIFRFKDL